MATQWTPRRDQSPAEWLVTFSEAVANHVDRIGLTEAERVRATETAARASQDFQETENGA